jgi:hypothetical protein
MGMEPTPLGGEQDRADFEAWNQPDRFPDLAVRRGSMLRPLGRTMPLLIEYQSAMRCTAL